ncbi:MAG TPA: hypothetical protein VGM88_35515 [Kofleriaceae bacterium]|jgi:hypothetical protein
MGSRRTLAIGWIVVLAAVVVGHYEVLLRVGGYGLAVALASIGFRGLHDAADEVLTGNRRIAYHGTCGVLIALCVLGFGASVTGVSHASVFDAPLALFFMMVAILGWRAFVVASPGRATLVTFVALLAYIPLGAYAQVMPSRWSWSVPHWYGDVMAISTMGTLVCVGVLGLVSTVAFRERGDQRVPEARSV